MKTIQWFLLLTRCHFQPRVTEGHSWLEMAPSESQKPFHFLHTSDSKQILIFFKLTIFTCSHWMNTTNSNSFRDLEWNWPHYNSSLGIGATTPTQIQRNLGDSNICFAISSESSINVRTRCHLQFSWTTNGDTWMERGKFKHGIPHSASRVGIEAFQKSIPKILNWSVKLWTDPNFFLWLFTCIDLFHLFHHTLVSKSSFGSKNFFSILVEVQTVHSLSLVRWLTFKTYITAFYEVIFKKWFAIALSNFFWNILA